MQSDQKGNNPLHWGCVRSNVDNDFIELLLSHGARGTDRNKNGMTPMHVACMLSENDSKLDILRILLKQGADVTMKNNKWETYTMTVSAE